MSIRLLLVVAVFTVVGVFVAQPFLTAAGEKEPLNLNLRSRVKGDGDKYTVAEKKTDWDPKKTAIVICDMWDDHWCKNASRRVGEMAGPLNDTVKAARAKGVFV